MKRIVVMLLALCFSATTFAGVVDDLFRKANDPVVGNPHGNVTVVEFFDYECGYCIRMAPIIADVIQNNRQVRVVFKEYPIRGPMSDLGARAALAAKMQGKYYAFSHALLSTDQSISENSIMAIAKSVGLNVTRLQKDMQSSSITNQLRSNRRLADAVGVTGTPAFFIGPTNAQNEKQVIAVLGSMSQGELQDAIQKAGGM